MFGIAHADSAILTHTKQALSVHVFSLLKRALPFVATAQCTNLLGGNVSDCCQLTIHWKFALQNAWFRWA